MSAHYPCSHVWIDPADPPMARAPYSPVIGPRRREMKPGTLYRCQRCELILLVPRTQATTNDHPRE